MSGVWDEDRRRLGIAFGSALKCARELRNFTSEEIGEEAGLDKSYPRLLEAGERTPTISVIFALARALRMAPARLMDMTEEELEEIPTAKAVRRRLKSVR